MKKINSKDNSPDVSLDALIWKSRRGLLENDLILQKFFQDHLLTLSIEDKLGLELLLGLNDNDLLDLFLKRTELTGSLDTPNVNVVLEKIRGS